MDEIELPKNKRTDAVASLKRYFEANMDEPIGDLKAGALLNFFVEEVGPAIYNQAIRDAQARLSQRVVDLDGELFAEEFGYWPRLSKKRR
ncbi:DUF2164 domain-containing protein [Telmatobacter bradus]|uniref:DUF2164 domain-containing protein n=1 Tax=Telmatobacter bradus TaxID=474953 RepID=UPI003B42B5B1